MPVRSQAAGIHKSSTFQPSKGRGESTLLTRSGCRSVLDCRRVFNHVYMTGRKPERMGKFRGNVGEMRAYKAFLRLVRVLRRGHKL